MGEASHILWGNPQQFWVGGSAGAGVATGGGASVFIRNSVFRSNSAYADGADLHAESPEYLQIVNTTFLSNSSAYATVDLLSAPAFGCEHYSCQLGLECRFSDFSVFCQVNPHTNMREHELLCTECTRVLGLLISTALSTRLAMGTTAPHAHQASSRPKTRRLVQIVALAK